ncbi:zinc finger BED domain-containing protein RICESLEEPER 1-like isoform X1 [Bidens hawaiensis]|uniref:zinc finger BED domain-containing protein RICESLEEPER 1-like isoform X1 n=1 Tax=Bidens hawaiensis TaxID=980011 RepID=UPI00404AFF42
MTSSTRSAKRRKYDQESVTKALVEMIIVDELPFSVVEYEFLDDMEIAFPGFHMPSSETISEACFQLFMDEKAKLKSLINSTDQRVCLSLDTWMSKQSVNYLCITAHFIDNDWNLHKRNIGFSPICGNNGEEIGQVIEKCLHDWGINNVLTISATNTSLNNAAISYLGTRLVNPVLDGKFLRLKCFTDFTTIMIKQVFKDYDKWIVRVRAAVRYMLESPDRIKKFEDFARQHMMPSDSCLTRDTLDIPTIWFSTLTMLRTCQQFEDVFNWFEENDSLYKRELYNTCGNPVCIKWEKVRKAVCCLTGLFQLTVKEELNPNLSDVTSNIFLGQILEADYGLVDEKLSCVRSKKLFFKPVEMKWKYNEYWGDVKDSNMLIYIANILDPGFKMDLIECSFGKSMTFRHEYTDEGEPSWKKKTELVVSAILICLMSMLRSLEPHINLQTFKLAVLRTTCCMPDVLYGRVRGVKLVLVVMQDTCRKLIFILMRKFCVVIELIYWFGGRLMVKDFRYCLKWLKMFWPFQSQLFHCGQI